MPKTPLSYFENGDSPWMDIGDAAAALSAAHPRVVFIKTLPRHATLLDVGAGDGSLAVFKDWLSPTRHDLKIFAYAMEKGARFEACDGYELGTWPMQKPDFEGRQFDAIFSAHFIEHIPQPMAFLRWASKRLCEGGRLYCEWPSEHALDQHRVSEFKQRDVPIQISHFHDDRTHQALPPSRAAVVEALEAEGLLIDQQGFVHNPYLEQEALAHFAQGRPDSYLLQAALWSNARWAQFVVATKVPRAIRG